VPLEFRGASGALDKEHEDRNLPSRGSHIKTDDLSRDVLPQPMARLTDDPSITSTAGLIDGTSICVRSPARARRGNQPKSPFAAGGGADIVARLMGPWLSERLSLTICAASGGQTT
jgi:hypothetical protein